ncbi:MAG TPA: TadE/TadG family type IV pilus assembly protein [Terracidiphilus sp.]|jgi:Flp pilus assembly protein TadG
MSFAKLLTRIKSIGRTDGASMVELALVVGFFGPLLLLGTAELSILVYDSIELADAAHAGADYASQYYIANSNTALPAQSQVTTAVTNDAPELVGMLKSGTSLTATISTGCGTGSASAGNTVPTCNSGTLPYVKVTATATVVPIFQGFRLSSVTMTSNATVSLVN